MGQVNPIDAAENSGIDTRAQGNVIRVTTNDPKIAVAITAGYDRLSVERSTDQGLTYEEISHASERPVLKADQFVYEFFDRCGDPGYLYRTRYVGTIKGEKACTAASPAMLGAGLAVRNILTVEQLKSRYMFGLDLTNDKGEPLEDDVYLSYIMAAIRGFEKQVDIPLLPTTFVEKHDYYRNDYHSFNFIHLDNTPVLAVDEFRVQYPSGQNVIIFPGEWIRLSKLEGHVQIVPTSGTLSEILVGQGGSFLPAIYNGLDYLPELFEVAYTAGFEDGKIPADIINLIGMMAAIGPFHIFGDLIAGAGIANISLSMDGLSQSVGTTSSATNCLRGDTPVYTDGGEIPISDLVGKTFRIWDGEAWYDAEAVTTGEREVAATQLTNDVRIVSSPDHLFRVIDDAWIVSWKAQRDLAQGDKVLTRPDENTAGEHLYPTAEVVEAWTTTEREHMFDIKVDNDRHLFFAYGIAVHNSGYGARVGNYLKEIKAAIPMYKQWYRGIKMTWA